jgi:hypothetical protein
MASSAPPAPLSAVAQLLADRRRLLAAAEEILRSAAANTTSQHAHEALTAEERSILELLGWDSTRQDRELGRMRSVIAAEAAAGSAADLRKLEARGKKAAEALATRGGEIRQQIAALEAELAELAREDQQLSEELERRKAARERLRELAPAHVREQVEDATRAIRREFFEEKAALELRLDLARQVPEITDPEQQLLHATGAVEQEHPGLVVRREFRASDGRSVLEERIDSSVWDRYVEGLRAARPGLEARLAKLEAALLERTREAELALDFYAGRL